MKDIKYVVFDFGDTLAMTSNARRKMNNIKFVWGILNKKIKCTYASYIYARKKTEIEYSKLSSKKHTPGMYFKILLTNLDFFDSHYALYLDKQYRTKFLINIKLNYGVKNILYYLKNRKIKMFILSNGHKRNILPVLRKYGIRNYFADIIATFDVGKEKRELVPFKFLISKHKLNPKKGIFIGNDIKEDMIVKKLGMLVLFLNQTLKSYKKSKKFDHEIKTLSSIKYFV